MEVLLWTVLIFVARVADVGLGTLRVQFIVRRQKVLAALIGFVEILIFILIVSRVIQDIQHWSYVLAYAAGFAAGTLLGMVLSDKLNRRIVQATVIYKGARDEMEAAVIEAGFALTHYTGTGRDGPVAVLDVVCSAEALRRLTDVVTKVDPKAFLYTQELSGLRGGHVYGLKSKI
jgi:uncharacterized protein YebE (UPF0316 family)